MQTNPILKLALITDLHTDFMPDATTRLAAFLDMAKAEGAGAILQLGDFAFPKRQNEPLRDMFNHFPAPHFHVLGNHDSGWATAQATANWLGMPGLYYSFALGGFTFIVLDTNWLQTQNGEYIHYFRRNIKTPGCRYPVLPPWQLAWLETELAKAPGPVVLLSHHSLVNPFMQRSIANRDEVQALLHAAKANGTPVPLALNGHDHADGLTTQHGTAYLTLNSASYVYATRLLPYREPLYTLLELKPGCAHVKGKVSAYTNTAPWDLGIRNWNGYGVEPLIKERTIPLVM